jgi:hypothetical protein
MTLLAISMFILGALAFAAGHWLGYRRGEAQTRRIDVANRVTEGMLAHRNEWFDAATLDNLNERHARALATGYFVPLAQCRCGTTLVPSQDNPNDGHPCSPAPHLRAVKP